MVVESIDVLLISESKLDHSFPEGHFLINGFHSPFREDRNDKGDGLLLYVRAHVPCRRLNVNFEPVIAIEINLRKRKVT